MYPATLPATRLRGSTLGWAAGASNYWLPTGLGSQECGGDVAQHLIQYHIGPSLRLLARSCGCFEEAVEVSRSQAARCQHWRLIDSARLKGRGLLKANACPFMTGTRFSTEGGARRPWTVNPPSSRACCERESWSRCPRDQFFIVDLI